MQISTFAESSLPYLLLEPDHAGRNYDEDGLPLFMLLHGRGSNADDLAGLGRELDQQRYRYVVPNAPLTISLGMFGEGFAWYEINEQQATGIRQSRLLLEQFLEHLEQRFKTPRQQTIIGGFSQGAVLAMETGLRSPGPFAAIIALSGYLVPDDELKALLPERRDRRLLIVHGTEDQVVWIQTARATVEQLREYGVEPVYKEYVMGHQVIEEELMLIRRFLAETFAPTE